MPRSCVALSPFYSPRPLFVIFATIIGPQEDWTVNASQEDASACAPEKVGECETSSLTEVDQEQTGERGVQFRAVNVTAGQRNRYQEAKKGLTSR